MKITISKEAREKAHEQAAQEVIQLAKEAVEKNNSSFTFHYAKYGNNFFMSNVGAKVEELTEGTVRGGNRCHDSRAKTYIFTIKEE